MTKIHHTDPAVTDLGDAIRAGDLETLNAILSKRPELAGATFTGDDDGQFSSLHLATDWPGHFPQVAESIQTLLEAGANPNARCQGPHTETPLHYAASSNDVNAIDALVAGGADMEMDGSVTDGGTPLSAAINFENWDAARRLVKHGARTNLFMAASLGMLERVKEIFQGEPVQPKKRIDGSFWCACNTGELATAQFLAEKEADLNYVPGWDDKSPLHIAQEKGHHETVAWLKAQGAMSTAEDA